MLAWEAEDAEAAAAGGADIEDGWLEENFEIFPTDSVSVLPREGAYEAAYSRTSPPDTGALSSVSGPRGALDGGGIEDEADGDGETDSSFAFVVDDESDWEIYPRQSQLPRDFGDEWEGERRP